MRGPASVSIHERGPPTAWVPWVVLALLGARLFARVSTLAVELPFWDQWDFWNAIFDGAGPWTYFRWQHGPQYQGLGGLVLWASARASGLSVRAEVFVSTTLVVAGAAVFLVFVRRVRGRLDALDSAIPLVLLNGLQADAIVTTPNPAHGPAPFLLLCLAPLCASLREDALRLPLLVALAAASTYTGFAYLLVPPLLAVLAADLWRAAPGARARHAVALAASAGVAATFLVGFVPASAVDCFVFPDKRPWNYVPFAAIVLARPLGASSLKLFPILVTVVTPIALSLTAAWGAWRTWSRERDDVARAAFLLGGSALLFAATTAVGRVCLGLGPARAERYVPYVLPAIAAAYVVIRSGPSASRKDAAALAACAFLIGAEAWQATHPVPGTVRIAEGKRQFLACLRAGGSAHSCTTETGFEIYPRPEATHLEEKIEFLRSRRLGPFLGR